MPKRTGKFYRKNEAEVMRSLGLVPTKNSGSGWIEKEDGQNEYIIAQLKSTDAKSIRVSLEDIHTLEYNAVVAHKIPAFVIQFLETNELFVMAKPTDIPSIAQYLECGSCNVVKSELVSELVFEDEGDVEEKWLEQERKIIKSSAKARAKFHKEREKQWQNKKSK